MRYAVDVLAVALALEEGAQTFYGAVSGRLPRSGGKELFASLAEAESRHAAMLAEACSRFAPEEGCDLGEGGSPVEGLMEGAVSIEEASAFAAGEDRSAFDILELAMQVEASSLDLYLKIAVMPEFAAVRETLDELVGEEKKHLSRIGSLLEGLVRERGPEA